MNKETLPTNHQTFSLRIIYFIVHSLPKRSCNICRLNFPPKTAKNQAVGQLSAVATCCLHFCSNVFGRLSKDFLK